MDAETLGDLLAPARRSEDLAYRNETQPARSHTYARFCEAGWQAASLLRHYGVHDGSRIGIIDAAKEPAASSGESRTPGTPLPEVLLAFLGAGMLGARVLFDPPASFQGDLLLGPAARIDDVDSHPGRTRVAYGGPPSDPAVVHFEAAVWSETPIAPPEAVTPETPVLTTAAETYTHANLLAAGREFVTEQNLARDDAVAIDAPLSVPGSVVGGVVAPLLAGATIQVGNGATTVLIGSDGVEPGRVTPSRSDGRSSRA